MRRHRHTWTRVASTYHAPSLKRASGELDALEWEVMRLLALGFTTISLVCAECGDVDTKVVAGHWKPSEAGP